MPIRLCTNPSGWRLLKRPEKWAGSKFLHGSYQIALSYSSEIAGYGSSGYEFHGLCICRKLCSRDVALSFPLLIS